MRQVRALRQSGHQRAEAFSSSPSSLRVKPRMATPVSKAGTDHRRKAAGHLPPTTGRTSGMVSEALRILPNRSPMDKVAAASTTEAGHHTRNIAALKVCSQDRK